MYLPRVLYFIPALSYPQWRGEDSNLRSLTTSGLQPDPFGHSGTPPGFPNFSPPWRLSARYRFRLRSWRRDLNPQPADYKSAALPIELRQRALPTMDTVHRRATSISASSTSCQASRFRGLPEHERRRRLHLVTPPFREHPCPTGAPIYAGEFPRVNEKRNVRGTEVRRRLELPQNWGL